MIYVSCPSGHRLKVNDKLAGKSIQCPKCKAVVPVTTETDAGVSNNWTGIVKPDRPSTAKNDDRLDTQLPSSVPEDLWDDVPDEDEADLPLRKGQKRTGKNAVVKSTNAKAEKKRRRIEWQAQ